MTGLDKIIEHIKQDAQATADAKIAEAKAEAQELLAKAAEEEKALLADAKEAADAAGAQAKERGVSAAALAKRKILLTAKQELITKTLEAAKKAMTEQADDEYFKTLEALVKKHAQAEAGKIMFSKKDKARIPAAFTKTLEGYKLTVAEETQEMSGGFILLYGDIEENCSFDALFLQAKEELQDKVRDYLFA